MKKPSSVPANAKPALDGAEWDFSACPASEAIQCFYYEYARSSEAFCANYEQLRKTTTPDALKSRFFWLQNGYRFSLDCPEFPKTPWLKISNAVKSHRICQRFVFVQNSCEPTYPIRPFGFNPNTGEEVLKFEVCWMATKGQIIADFEKWVDKWVKKRQQEIEANQKSKIASPEINDEAGVLLKRHQPVKSAKELLKALSAYRLLKTMSAAEAHQLTLSDKFALYQNPPAWTRAKTHAAKIIGYFGTAIRLPNEILPEPVVKSS